MRPLKLTLAQLDFTVGALNQNSKTILATMQAHQDSDIIVFPELALTGYPPEDLLFREDFEQLVAQAITTIATAAQHSVVVIGHPQRVGNELFNSVSVLYQGQLLTRYHKQRLPQYGVFDEQRYFIPGHQTGFFDYQGYRIGLLICEDIWHAEPWAALQREKVDLVLSLNASPYEVDKHQQRLHILQQRIHEKACPVIYVNNCGGQDELVFDGHSLVLSATGELVAELPHCEPCCATLSYSSDAGFSGIDDWRPYASEPLALIYQALVLSVRDYVQKNGFKGVTLGLSGGIDSALTLAIAADALGAAQVHAVMMPFKYTSQMSQDDAQLQAERMGVNYDVVAIEPIYDSFMQQLSPLFGDDALGTTTENLQARSRGVIVMALSNKTGSLVLTTGNKSELAVGYCTLYGDMCGGFAPLKDIPKTLVFALARYRNQAQEVIPERVITRPPSAELAPDQKDEDNLPPYEVLDKILTLYVEQDWSAAAIIECGFDRADVLRVIKLVDINEYKRRQGAVGPKITSRNFSKDRRYPITNHFRYEIERQLEGSSKP